MSRLTNRQNEKIKRAYEGYLEYVSSEEVKIKYENLANVLDSFKEKLRTWRSSDSMDFIVDFATSPEAKVFAGAGMGMMFIEDFKIFMNMQVVREKLEKMIYYKFKEDDNVTKHNSIVSYDIRRFLDDNEFNFKKPRLLTGRLLLMIFTELYTVIADEPTLDDKCTALDIKINGNPSYLARHRRIRFMIDAYINENNLSDEVSELDRASIAWWVPLD